MMQSITERNPWNIKDLGVYILLLAIEILVVWVIILLLGILQMQPLVADIMTSLPQSYMIFFLYLIQTLFLGLPLGILLWQKRVENKKEACLLNRTKWYTTLLLAPAVYFGTMVVMAIIMGIFMSNNIEVPGFTGEKTQIIQSFGSDTVGMILAFISAVLIAPIIEEIVFRGMLLRAFAKHTPVWTAVLFSSIVFSLIHFTPGVFFPLMILGAVMAVLTVKTRSIYPAIVFHMINNSMAFVAEIVLKYAPQEYLQGVLHLWDKLL